MAQNKTQYDFRSTLIDKKIVTAMNNGVIILDSELRIHHYNRWLEIDIFGEIKEKTLLRKIKTALRMHTPTYYTAITSHYLIPIKINQIENAHFSYMQQDVSIIPFDNL